MNNGNKNKFTLIIISIVVFLLLVFSAAYAIISSTYTYDNKNVNATIGLRPIFTAGPSNTIAMNIPYVAGTRNSVYEISNESSPFNVTLQTNYEEKTTCTYDIIWEWDETSDATKQYIKTSGATKEFTVSGSTTGASFTDVQLNDYSSQDRTTLLYSGSISVKGNNIIKIQEWTITTRFYKTTQDQSNHRSKSYTGKVLVNNVICARDDSPDGTGLALEVIPKSNQTSSQSGGGTYEIVNEGNGIRYEGKDPDNYVCFKSSCTDDELYRIIGKFTEMVDTTNNGVANTQKQVIKIIKNTSAGNYEWDNDSSPYAYVSNNNVKIKLINNNYNIDIAAGDPIPQGQNNWSVSSLKKYLNDNWAKPYNNIITTRWYLKSPSNYQDIDTQEFLNMERNGVKYSSNPDYWDGLIGLMYPSDYGYAAPSSSCSRTIPLYAQGSNINYTSDGCANADWLKYGANEWLLTPYINNDATSLFKYTGGYISTLVVDMQIPVRPAFYIDANTEFASGNGSKANPYKITSASNLISFSIDGVTYQAEDGMGMRTWVESAYNTNNIGTDSCHSIKITSSNTTVYRPFTPDDTTIIANEAYSTYVDPMC